MLNNKSNIFLVLTVASFIALIIYQQYYMLSGVEVSVKQIEQPLKFDFLLILLFIISLSLYAFYTVGDDKKRKNEKEEKILKALEKKILSKIETDIKEKKALIEGSDAQSPNIENSSVTISHETTEAITGDNIYIAEKAKIRTLLEKKEHITIIYNNFLDKIASITGSVKKENY